MKRRLLIIITALAVLAAIYYGATWHRRQIVLTGIVTTDEVVVSAEIQGRLQQLLVKEGDVVKSNELLAAIQPQEWQADMAYYASSEKQSSAQVAQSEADLKYMEQLTSNQIAQAEASLSASEAQVVQAEADLENAKLTYKREADLYKRGVESAQVYDQSRTSQAAAEARVEAARKQALAARAAVELARANGEQVAARHAALQASRDLRAAMGAQKEKAQVHLDYTKIRAPIDGIVDVRAALQGEVVNPGQGIVTLINPDNLWVRADVEETYIDRIHLGDKLSVRLPSGEVRAGTVFFRGVDAAYATQRDVSRTKRDIKTFEIRVRCDNQDRALAVGMSAYVTLPLGAGK